MKRKVILAIVGLLLQCAAGYAQTGKSGIYLNLADYQNNKLTYEMDGSNNKEKINPNELFYKPYITVFQNGKKYRPKKSEIFGFRDNNKVYRFFNNQKYLVEESDKIYIYSRQRNQSQGKNGSTIAVKDYYFSTSINEVVRPLTVANLKNAFPENRTFNELLNENFKDGIAYVYDDFHKKYKVNHLYQMSLQQ